MMDQIEQLELLGANWIIGQVSPPITPSQCRPSIKRFAEQHSLNMRAPLRAPLYFVSIWRDVRVELVGWLLQDLVKAAIVEYERRAPAPQPTPTTNPEPAAADADRPDLRELRRARALEIQQIQEPFRK
jgi:hypothetical protein